MKGKNDGTSKDAIVGNSKVYDALVWLKNNNNCYKDIEIDLRAIDTLQENSILADLPTVTTD